MNQWVYNNLPRVWARYWSARLLATTWRAQRLHSGHPEFTWWDNVVRFTVTALVFCFVPRLPVRIRVVSKCPAGHPEHTWIYYHSSETRWCHDCHREEKLWADFGLTKKGQSDDSK